MSEGDILNALPMTLSPRKKSSLKVSHLRKQSGDTHGFNSLTRINTSGLNALVEVATPITPNVEIPISLSAPEALRRVSKTAVSVKSKLSSNSQSIPSSLQNVSSAPQFNDTSTHINLRLPSIAAIEVSQKDEVVQEMNAFLTFRSPEVELSYGRYFMIKTIPLWRTGLIVGFLLSVIMFIFNLLNRTPNYFVTETLIYVFAVVLPLTILLYISSNTFKSPTIFVNLVHYISTFSILIIGGISLSIRHYIQENKEPAYKTALFYSLLVLGAHLVLRIRFIFLVFAIPCLFTFFVIEASITSVQNIASANETTNHLFTSTICLFAFMLVTLFSSYKSEQSSRLDFTTTSSSKASASKLRDQLNRLQKTYTNQSGEFDSPLEKSIVIVRSIMADPAIKSKHVNALSKLLGLLKSGDLMTPQIEKQVEGAELDKDQEVFFNLIYRLGY